MAVVVSSLMLPMRAWYGITVQGKTADVKGRLEACGVVGSSPC